MFLFKKTTSEERQWSLSLQTVTNTINVIVNNTAVGVSNKLENMPNYCHYLCASLLPGAAKETISSGCGWLAINTYHTEMSVIQKMSQVRAPTDH